MYVRVAFTFIETSSVEVDWVKIKDVSMMMCQLKAKTNHRGELLKKPNFRV